MMNVKRLGVWAAVLAVGGLSFAAYAEEPAKPAAGGKGMVGKPAPDFTGTDVEGKTHKLSDLKGKIVVLEWSSSKCPFVKHHVTEQKTMQNTFAKYQDKGVVWLAVNSNAAEVENPDAIKTFASENKIEYPIILDADGTIGKSFGAKTTPHMFVIDKNGVVAYEGAIDSDPTLKAPEATNYVDAAVQSLVDGSEVATKWQKSYGCPVKYGKGGAEMRGKTDKKPGGE